MNERIEELMLKSGMVSKSDTPGVVWTTKMSVSTAEKFAELIVKECFDVIIADGRFHDVKGIIKAAKYTAMEHFGVGADD